MLCLVVKSGLLLLVVDLKNPAERLGSNVSLRVVEIQSHPFFKTVDWEQLYAKQITPPYKPLLKSESDLDHFDPTFTAEPVQLTPDDLLAFVILHLCIYNLYRLII